LLDILAVAEMQTEGSPTWFTKGMFTLSTPHERLHSIRKRSRRLGVAAAAFALAATSLAAGAPAANATDATPESITETVYFASMQSKLDDVAQATLDVFLLRVPLDATDVSASVVGWVMATRSKANDRRLSKARAVRTAAYLASHGITGEITAEGRGAKNRTAAARSATVTITYTPSSPPPPAGPSATVPCRIRYVSATEVGLAVNASFVLGCDGGSPITSVQYKVTTEWVTIPVSGPFSIPETEPGSVKDFEIRAVNAVGPGPAIDVRTIAGMTRCAPPESIGKGPYYYYEFGEGMAYYAYPGEWTGNPTFTYQWYDGWYPEGLLLEGETNEYLYTGYEAVYVVITAHSGSCSTSTYLQMYPFT
jgi:outer membrane protein OmpA-like peptidoglycan-associated protein